VIGHDLGSSDERDAAADRAQSEVRVLAGRVGHFCVEAAGGLEHLARVDDVASLRPDVGGSIRWLRA